jgi:adenine-specific DNA-methyltransferase
MPKLHFKGKPLVQNHHLVVPFSELEAVKSRGLSKTPSLHDNLIIEGDNLKALKALLPAYHGKVKCIYIDPPYNTGNEGWIYNDRVNSPMMRDWFNKTVDRDDLTRHDKWCCMMLPRLKLLRELLARDGIIAISIDDNEVAKLCELLDEVFPPENRLAIAPWKAEPSGGKQKKGLRVGHEYLVIYHNGDDSGVSREELSTGELDLRDEVGKYRKGRELRKWGQGSLRTDRPDSWFELVAPDGTRVLPYRNDGKEGRWRWGKAGKMRSVLENPKLAHWETCSYDEGVAVKGRTERWVPFEKIRDRRRSFGWSTWLDSFGFNSDGTREIKEIFGEKVFDTVKPTELLKWLISLHTDDEALVLDSTAGSGTTAHAVLALNKEDEGKRRFILCQMPFETKEQEKKKENICESITAERVRRVIKGVPKAKDENLRSGLGGTFSYFKLGRELEKQAILDGKDLPGYEALAGYVFWTATGEEFQPNKVKRKEWFIGESREYAVFLIYDDDLEKLKDMALTLDIARALPEVKGKRKLVFAPTKYLDDDFLTRLRIEFCQLPFEIYEAAEEK